MPNNRNIRLHTTVGEDKYVNVNLEQDFESIDILSLSIDKSNALYKVQTSDYGCVVGRVIANGGFGVPNAKISIFIEKNEGSNVVIDSLYPYSLVTDKNDDNIRYNLLPEDGGSVCYQPVGTFPSKRMMLDDENVIEIYEKYYKYTTRSNNSGDYMLFGVPVGNHIMHCDIDISDCGILSQKPSDLIQEGYNATQFESSSKFKKDTNLDALPQIISENKSVDILPFWGDKENNIVGITRNDIEISFKFQPSCVFIGSIFTDDTDNGIGQDCVATDDSGVMEKLTTGMGTIEMIRKRADGNIEEFQVDATQLIDENGTWCYRIPMNLDYVIMDEYGNIIPTDDTERGIPTRTRVRFRISMNEIGGMLTDNHTTKILVPHNPKSEEDEDYIFGTDTKDDEFGTKSFRDLFWNKIYTVKSYIPRIQKDLGENERRFTGIKEINYSDTHNKMPYNNIRSEINRTFKSQCKTMNLLIWWAHFFNTVFNKNISVGDGLCPELEGWYFVPKGNLRDALSRIKRAKMETDDPESSEYGESANEKICVTNNINYFKKCMEISMAAENKVLKFDFFNDWINGALYIPRWFANVKIKKKYSIGKKRITPVLQACVDKSFRGYRYFVSRCSLKYRWDYVTKTFTDISSPVGCKNNKSLSCTTNDGSNFAKILNNLGIVHKHTTYLNEDVYYLRPYNWDEDDTVSLMPFRRDRDRLAMNNRTPLFATDIVLLGSFDECDKNGIANMIEELESTTYKMPPGLAETNMGQEGYMFGTKDGTYLCDGIDSDGIQKIEDTFANYETWSDRTDTDNDAETSEYPVTTRAGVDWGYLGPNQLPDNPEIALNQGGHFVSVSCGRVYSNIKTCVNLSRICEIGVIPSGRQNFVVDDTEEGSTPSYRNYYMIPNGLISKDEIVKHNFRQMFATMNFNRLKTKRNKDDNRLEYDFEYLSPKNFGGDMKRYTETDGEPYKEGDENFYNGMERNDEGKSEVHGDGKTLAYNMSREYTSRDYYYFRLGIPIDKWEDKDYIASKYMYNNGAEVSTPLYENSFYFYFGLFEGKTALDRLISMYYAPCPNPNAYNSRYTVEAETIDYCETDGAANAYVQIYDMDGPYYIYLYKNEIMQKITLMQGSRNVIEISESGEEMIQVNSRELVLSGLTEDKYNIVIGSKNNTSIEKEFAIERRIPEALENIIVTGVDFATEINGEVKEFVSYGFNGANPPLNRKDRKWTESGDEKDDEWKYGKEGDYNRWELGGYIKLPKYEISEGAGFKGYVIKGTSKKKRSDKDDEPDYINFNDISSEIGEDNCCCPLVWEGNAYYGVYALWQCEGKEEPDEIPLDKVYIKMDGCADFYYGDETVSLRKAKKVLDPSLFDEKWYLNDLNSQTYLDGENLWIFKRGLFITKSIYDISPKSVNADFMNPKTGNVIYGGAETYEEDVNKISLRTYYVEGGIYYANGCSQFNFILPTNSDDYLRVEDAYRKNGKELEVVYGESETRGKRPLMASFNNKNFNYTSQIDAIYRPFYMRTFIVQISNYFTNPEDVHVDNAIHCNIANGISCEKKLGVYKYRLNDNKGNTYGEDNIECPVKKNNYCGYYGITPDEIDYVGDLALNSRSDKHHFAILEHLNDYTKHTDTSGYTEDKAAYTMEELYSSTSIDIKEGLTTHGGYISGAISVTDSMPADYLSNLCPETLTSSFNIHFLDKNDETYTYTAGIRYYYMEINGRPLDIFKKVNPIKFTHYYENNNNNDTKDWIDYEDDGRQYKLPKYWQGIYTKYRGGKYILKEFNIDEVLDVYNDAKLEEKYSKYVFIGLYDNTTRLNDVLYDEVKDDENKRFHYILKNSNELSVIRHYDKGNLIGEDKYENEFIEILKKYRDKWKATT